MSATLSAASRIRATGARASHPPAPSWPSALPLAAAAARVNWSARTLRRRLKFHGIPTIGSGRRARVTLGDFNRLRQSNALQAAPTRQPRAVLVGPRDDQWPTL